MKKMLIYILPLFILAIFGLYYWQAEHRVGPPIKNIHMATFDIKGISNPEHLKSLSLDVAKIEGVTACSINEASKIAAITFYPDLLSHTKLKQLIAISGKCAVTEHTFKQAPGCPLNSWRSLVHTIFSFNE